MAPEKEKITSMILYVDLKCPCCYKKVRKLLSKFPQIRDQVFDVDKNKVTITVVCCDPERFRDKLCCKGGRAIQSIKIVEDKPPPPKPTPAPVFKPNPRVDKHDTPKPADPPKPPTPTTMPPTILHPPAHPRPQPAPEPKPPPKPKPKPMPVDCYHPHQPFCPPVSACCQECYEGRYGGPCHYGYGRHVPPPPCYDYYGYLYLSYRPCYVSRCDYFSEDNPQGCSIM